MLADENRFRNPYPGKDLPCSSVLCLHERIVDIEYFRRSALRKDRLYELYYS